MLLLVIECIALAQNHHFSICVQNRCNMYTPRPELKKQQKYLFSKVDLLLSSAGKHSTRGVGANGSKELFR